MIRLFKPQPSVIFLFYQANQGQCLKTHKKRLHLRNIKWPSLIRRMIIINSYQLTYLSSRDYKKIYN